MSRHEEQLAALVRTLGVHTPTAEQAAVITHPLTVPGKSGALAAPLLVVAGAGSGKTETVSLRAVYLAAADDVDDDGILGLTFTRKAAAELKGRLTERLAQLASSRGEAGTAGFLQFESAPVATTYNAFALDVVREFGPQLGIDSDRAHMDAAARWQLMHEVVEQWRGPITSGRAVSTVTNDALSLREAIANQGMSLDEARRALERLDERFARREEDRSGDPGGFFVKGRTGNDGRLEYFDILRAFDEEKEALRRIDFADQVRLATKVVRSLPEAREELRRRHQVVFLDEFQDTSVAQMEFLSELFHDHPVTAVGDPNQAIYGWRGASAASLDEFHRRFTRNSDAPKTVLNLSTAWRNSQTVLDVANTIALPLRTPPAWASEVGRETWTPSPVLEPRKGATPGRVRAVYRQTTTEQNDEVLTFVEGVLERAHEAGRPRPTMAVLCPRRNRVPSILEKLRSAGIPAESNGAAGLLMHPVILDLRAALEISADIGVSAQLLRLLTNAGFGSKDLWRLGRWARELASSGDRSEGRPTVLLLEAVDRSGLVPEEQGLKDSGLSEEGYRRLRRLGAQLRTIRRAADRTVVEQVELARQVLRLDEEAIATGQVPYLTEVLDAFSEQASQFQDQGVATTMRGFLSWLRVAEEEEKGLDLPVVAQDPGAVQVMTIHAAKGLEWDAVAVVGLETGELPSTASSHGSRWARDGQGPVPPGPTPAPQSGWWGARGELPYPARRDRDHLPDPPIWDPDMNVGNAQNLFREDVGEYLLGEQRRLAYVAMTRPREDLLLVGSWLGEGRTQPRYPSVFLREAREVAGVNVEFEDCPTKDEAEELTQPGQFSSYPKQPGRVRKQVTLSAAMVKQEMADLAGAHAGNEAAERYGAGAASVEALLREVPDPNLAARARFLVGEHREHQAARTADPKVRAEQDAKLALHDSSWEFSATRLHGAATAPDLWLDLRRPLPAEVFAASALGTAFHQWAETQLRRVPASGVEIFGDSLTEDGPVPAEPGAALTAEDQEQLEKMKERFLAIPWLATAEVLGIEVPFAFEMEGVLVRGRIDAVFKDRQTGRQFLVDWKTGKPPKFRKGDERADAHLTQLGLYREAWRRRTGHPADSIEAKLVFVGAPTAEEVTLDQLVARQTQNGEPPLSLPDLMRQLRGRLTEPADAAPADAARGA